MLLHGDIRADNMFFAGDRLKVVDFQFACVGAGASDIAYLVSQEFRSTPAAAMTNGCSVPTWKTWPQRTIRSTRPGGTTGWRSPT